MERQWAGLTAWAHRLWKIWNNGWSWWSGEWLVQLEDLSDSVGCLCQLWLYEADGGGDAAAVERAGGQGEKWGWRWWRKWSKTTSERKGKSLQQWGGGRLWLDWWGLETEMNFQQGKKVKKGWREVHVAAGRRAQVRLLVFDFNVINNHAMIVTRRIGQSGWSNKKKRRKQKSTWRKTHYWSSSKASTGL